MEITPATAEALLKSDLTDAEYAVHSNVKVPLTDNQFSALVSFVFNLGAGSLKKSTLLRLLNAGDYRGAEAEFVKWNRAGGKVLPGLTKRREAEANLFARK